MAFGNYVPQNNEVQRSIHTAMNALIEGKKLMFNKHRADKHEARIDAREQHLADMRPFQIRSAERREEQEAYAHQFHETGVNQRIRANALRNAMSLDAALSPQMQTFETPQGTYYYSAAPLISQDQYNAELPWQLRNRVGSPSPINGLYGGRGVQSLAVPTGGPAASSQIKSMSPQNALPGRNIISTDASLNPIASGRGPVPMGGPVPTPTVTQPSSPSAVSPGGPSNQMPAEMVGISGIPGTELQIGPDGSTVIFKPKDLNYSSDPQTGGFFNSNTNELMRFGDEQTSAISTKIKTEMEDVDSKAFAPNLTEHNIFSQLTNILDNTMTTTSRKVSEEAAKHIVNHALTQVGLHFTSDEIELGNVYNRLINRYTGIEGTDAIDLSHMNTLIKQKIESAQDPWNIKQWDIWGAEDVSPAIAAEHVREIAEAMPGYELKDIFAAYNSYAMTHLVDGEAFDDYDQIGTMNQLHLTFNDNGTIRYMADDEIEALSKTGDPEGTRLGEISKKESLGETWSNAIVNTARGIGRNVVDSVNKEFFPRQQVPNEAYGVTDGLVGPSIAPTAIGSDEVGSGEIEENNPEMFSGLFGPQRDAIQREADKPYGATGEWSEPMDDEGIQLLRDRTELGAWRTPESEQGWHRGIEDRHGNLKEILGPVRGDLSGRHEVNMGLGPDIAPTSWPLGGEFLGVDRDSDSISDWRDLGSKYNYDHMIKYEDQIKMVKMLQDGQLTVKDIMDAERRGELTREQHIMILDRAFGENSNFNSPARRPNYQRQF